MNIADVVRNLIIRAKAEGVDQTAQSLKSLAQAHDQAGKSAQAHAQASETSARRQLSMDQAFERLERRFNSTVRAQQDYAKVQAQVNAAVAQNPALQTRANDVLALAAAHYGRASQAQSIFAQGMQAVQGGAIALSGRLGTMGSVLVGLGPAGLAAGAALGLVAYGVTRIAHASSDLADRAGKLVDFAQTTGLTTDALQGLVKAGAQVGVEADKVGTSIERFTVQIEQLRKGSGDLYESVRQVDQVLADQLAGTRTTAEAWDLLAEAYRRADEGQRNLIARGAFGQRNLGAGRLLGESADAGGLDALISRSRELGAIDEKRLRTLDQIGDRLNELRRSSIDRFLIRGAEHELKVAEDFYSTLNKIQDWMDSFNISATWDKFIKDLNAVVFPKTTAMLEQQAVPTQPASIPSPILPAPNLGPGIDIGVSKYKEFLSILGPAATQSEKLKLQILELGQAALKAGASQETYNRALAALQNQATAGLRTRIQGMEFENSLIGKSTEETARLRAEWEGLSQIREEAARTGKTEEEILDTMGDQGDEVRRLARNMGEVAAETARATEMQQRLRSAAGDTGGAIQRSAEMMKRLADECERAAHWSKSFKPFPGDFSPTGKSQFDPAGYQSSRLMPITGSQSVPGGVPGGGLTWVEGQGWTVNSAGLTKIVDQVLGSGGSLLSAIEAVFKTGSGSDQFGIVSQISGLLSESDQKRLLEQQIAIIAQQPATLARELLLQQLRDSLDSLNSTIQDVLSPLYNSDPRTTRLGFRAGSGVYNPGQVLTDAQTGVLPGMATGGEMTVPGGFSSVDNMLLPVASGEKIRVSRDGNSESQPIVVNAPITINGMSGDRGDVRETAFQLTQSLARAVQAGMSRG